MGQMEKLNLDMEGYIAENGRGIRINALAGTN